MDFLTAVFVICLLCVILVQVATSMSLEKKARKWAIQKYLSLAGKQSPSRRARLFEWGFGAIASTAVTLNKVALGVVVFGVIGFVIVNFFPVIQNILLQVVEGYWPHLIEFATLLVTVSSVLLGFAFATEAILATRSSERAREFVSNIRNVKLLGLVCLVLTIGALACNVVIYANVTYTESGKYLLALAILSLILQVGCAASLQSPLLNHGTNEHAE